MMAKFDKDGDGKLGPDERKAAMATRGKESSGKGKKGEGKGKGKKGEGKKKEGKKKIQIIEQQSLSFDQIDKTKVVISF